MTRRLVAALFTILMLAAPAAAQTIFIVRHAERADAGTGGATTMAADPDLSEAGKARAEALVSLLKDARITAIYTTQYKRTRQTAEPLAKAIGVPVTEVPAADTAGLIAKLKAGGNALVVGHSNTVGRVIEQLGATDAVKLADEDYDNLFVLVRGEKPTLIRLHFR